MNAKFETCHYIILTSPGGPIICCGAVDDRCGTLHQDAVNCPACLQKMLKELRWDREELMALVGRQHKEIGGLKNSLRVARGCKPLPENEPDASPSPVKTAEWPMLDITTHHGAALAAEVKEEVACISPNPIRQLRSTADNPLGLCSTCVQYGFTTEQNCHSSPCKRFKKEGPSILEAASVGFAALVKAKDNIKMVVVGGLENPTLSCDLKAGEAWCDCTEEFPWSDGKTYRAAVKACPKCAGTGKVAVVAKVVGNQKDGYIVTPFDITDFTLAPDSLPGAVLPAKKDKPAGCPKCGRSNADHARWCPLQ